MQQAVRRVVSRASIYKILTIINLPCVIPAQSGACGLPGRNRMNDTLGLAGAAAALGIGMLIGLERERHKGRGDSRACAGLRTFAITALLGYVAMQVGGGLLVGIMAISVALLATVAYWRSLGTDPGVTSEVALFTVLALGAL